MAAPGVPLVIVDARGGFHLSVLLDQLRAAPLVVGRTIGMDIDGLGRISGRIEEIERAVNPASHTVAVKIELPDDSRLRSGVFGRAMIPGDERTLVTVPAAAIVRQGQSRSSLSPMALSRACGSYARRPVTARPFRSSPACSRATW